MSSSDKPGGQLWVAGMYAALIVTMLTFLVILAIVSDNAKYTIEWIPDATKTILDIVKILVGAVVGALTPAAVRRATSSQ
jgi:uncharacterized integral membrane protein